MPPNVVIPQKNVIPAQAGIQNNKPKRDALATLRARCLRSQLFFVGFFGVVYFFGDEF